jgi:hypothetical protein
VSLVQINVYNVVMKKAATNALWAIIGIYKANNVFLVIFHAKNVLVRYLHNVKCVLIRLVFILKKVNRVKM